MSEKPAEHPFKENGARNAKFEREARRKNAERRPPLRKKNELVDLYRRILVVIINSTLLTSLYIRIQVSSVIDIRAQATATPWRYTGLCNATFM